MKKTLKLQTNNILSSSGELYFTILVSAFFNLTTTNVSKIKISLQFIDYDSISQKKLLTDFSKAKITTTSAPPCSPNIDWCYFTLSLDFLLQILNILMVNFKITNTRSFKEKIRYTTLPLKQFYTEILLQQNTETHIYLTVINLSSVDVFSLVFLIFFYSLSLTFLYLIFSYERLHLTPCRKYLELTLYFFSYGYLFQVLTEVLIKQHIKCYF